MFFSKTLHPSSPAPAPLSNFSLFFWSLSSNLDARQPLPDGCEALLGSDVIHDDHTVGLAEELLGDAPVPAGKRGGGNEAMEAEEEEVFSLESLVSFVLDPHLSCPAVSHICSATWLLSTLMVLTL